ncbi:glycosyltransferase [Candidatus Shapirobacteria bacterium]|nr:glycosyltransferase [Candidatus Shapirobacteria bacterium]
MINSKKNKLFLAGGVFPFPKSSGGATRFYHTIKNLSKYFDIYLLLFKPSYYRLSPADTRFLKKHTRYYEIIVTTDHQSQDSFFSTTKPYWFSPWYHPDALLATRRIIFQNKIKFAQIDTTQIAYLIDSIPRTVFSIFVAYDICTTSFIRRLAEVKNLKTYIVHYIRYLEIYFYEQKYLKLFNKIVVMSPVDRKEVRRLFGVTNSISVPNGIESINFLNKSVDPSPLKIGLLGSFSHPPNRFAFSYFLENIAPLLNRQKINFNLYLVGNNSTPEIQSIVNNIYPQIYSKIHNLGFIKSTKSVFKGFDCLFAPIFSGSGTRVKIIEALSFGIPVITSPIGAEGIKTSNPFLTVAHTPQEYVNATKKLASINVPSNLIKLKTFLKPFLWSSIFDKYYQQVHHHFK